MDENATCEREVNRFQLGQVVATPGALAAIEASGEFAFQARCCRRVLDFTLFLLV